MKINHKIIITFFMCGIAFFAYCEDDNSGLAINIPEDGSSLSKEYPGNEAKPLYDDTFYKNDGDLITGDQEIILPPKEEKNFESNSEAAKFGLKRGFANLTLFWLEIPRNLSYEFTERPLSAVATAPFIALGLAGSRAIMGAMDVVSGGFNGYNSYGSIPTYPWEGPWVAKETSHY